MHNYDGKENLVHVPDKFFKDMDEFLKKLEEDYPTYSEELQELAANVLNQEKEELPKMISDYVDSMKEYIGKEDVKKISR